MSKYLRLRKNNRSAFTPPEIRKQLFANGKSLAGFMLLEVILSIFVISVGIVFVISSFITSIKAFKVSKLYLDALYRIEEKMWGYEERGEIEEGSDSGEFEDYKNAEWNIEAEEIEDYPLNKVTLNVTLKEDSRKREFKLVTYLYNKG